MVIKILLVYRGKLTNNQVYIHINNAKSKGLCEFDADFPNKDTCANDVFQILKQATVERLLCTLYAKKAELNSFSPNSDSQLKLTLVHSMQMVDRAQDINNDSVYGVLSNCQRFVHLNIFVFFFLLIIHVSYLFT